MKRLLLLMVVFVMLQAGEPPFANMQGRLKDLEARRDSTSPSIPKSPTFSGTRNEAKPLKMVTVSVNVWHNDPCDETIWKEILAEYYQLKNASFNPQELFAGITAFIKLTEEKKGQALWGGLSFTEVPDSQKIDHKKALGQL